MGEDHTLLAVVRDNVLLKTLQILVLWSMKYYHDKNFISNEAPL